MLLFCVKWAVSFNEWLTLIHGSCRRSCVTYVGLFDRRKLFQKSVIGSKQEPYIFLSKHLHCLLRGMDSRIKADCSRCNSLLHWRKAGHFCCQKKGGDFEGEGWRVGTERMKENKETSQRMLEGGRGELKLVELWNNPIWICTMAVWLWLCHSRTPASHMWGSYWWSRHIPAEHL